MKLLANSSSSIGAAFSGILLTAFIGFISIMMYDSANSTYKSEIQRVGDETTQEMEDAGRNYHSRLNESARNGWENKTIADLGEEAASELMADSEDAMTTAVSKKDDIDKAYQSKLTMLSVLNYFAMIVALASCGLGFINSRKIKLSLQSRGVGSGPLGIVFILFALGALFSLSNPTGISYRMPFYDDLNAEFMFFLCIVSVLLFIAGIVILFISSKKIYSKLPQFKTAYLGSLICVICIAVLILAFVIELVFDFGGLILIIDMIGMLVGWLFLIKGWFSAGIEDADITPTAN